MKKPELTYKDAIQLLETPKVIVNKEQRLSSVIIDFNSSHDYRLYMVAADAVETKPQFMLRIRVSSKSRTKISLHTQDGETNCCLIRLDYNGAPHTNPQLESETLPSIFRQYVGKVISPDHIHYHVEGYKSGAWAIPLDDDSFPVKHITLDGYTKNVAAALEHLSKVIHLETKIIYESTMIL